MRSLDTLAEPAVGTRTVLPRSTAFGPLTIAWDERVLEPRPWTQLQSRCAAELLADLPAGPVLELCTGAGQIGLLAALLSGRRLVAVDVDEVACSYARLNAERAGLGDRVDIRHADMDEALADDERFPLVIADPPWVRTHEISRFPEDPRLAIDGGDDGLALAHRCLAVAARHVTPDGAVIIQVGDEAQARALEGERWQLVGTTVGERGVLADLVLRP